MTYVLDASAILRYLDDEAGAVRMEAIVSGCTDGKCRVAVSAVNWGEVATKLFQKARKQYVEVLSELLIAGFEIVAATADRAVRAGIFKASAKIPYADAFGIELASSIPGSVLITGDFDFKSAAHDVKIEFLPKK